MQLVYQRAGIVGVLSSGFKIDNLRYIHLATFRYSVFATEFM